MVDLFATVAMVFGFVAVAVGGMAKSRTGSAASVCAGNVRQLMGGVSQYAMEANNRLPHPNWGFNPGYAGWLCQPPFSGRSNVIESGLLWRYAGSAGVYRCPSDKTNTASFQQRKQKLTSYIMNGAACFFEDQRRAETASISDLSPASILMWQADERNFRDYNDGASRADEGSTRTHRGRGPTGALDGSVQRMSVPEFNAEALRRPGRLWWNPKRKDGAG